jgi:hypothetical protein
LYRSAVPVGKLCFPAFTAYQEPVNPQTALFLFGGGLFQKHPVIGVQFHRLRLLREAYIDRLLGPISKDGPSSHMIPRKFEHERERHYHPLQNQFGEAASAKNLLI